MSARRKPAATPDIDALLAALADPARRRAVEMLGRSPLRAGELADRLGLAAPAMSRHLKALKAASLVAETHPEFDARVRVYALNTHRLSELKDWLARAEQGWSEQLAAFAAHVAEQQGKKFSAEQQGKKSSAEQQGKRSSAEQHGKKRPKRRVT